MLNVYLWFVFVVVVAAAVFFAAATLAPRDFEGAADESEQLSLRQRAARFWRDIRAGARALRRPGALRQVHEDNTPAATLTVDEFLDATATSRPGYLDADEIGQMIHSVRTAGHVPANQGDVH